MVASVHLMLLKWTDQVSDFANFQIDIFPTDLSKAQELISRNIILKLTTQKCSRIVRSKFLKCCILEIKEKNIATIHKKREKKHFYDKTKQQTACTNDPRMLKYIIILHCIN